MKILYQGAEPHSCPMPTTWTQWRQKLKTGAVIQCDCGQRWILEPHQALGSKWARVPANMKLGGEA